MNVVAAVCCRCLKHRDKASSFTFAQRQSKGWYKLVKLILTKDVLWRAKCLIWAPVVLESWHWIAQVAIFSTLKLFEQSELCTILIQSHTCQYTQPKAEQAVSLLKAPTGALYRTCTGAGDKIYAGRLLVSCFYHKHSPDSFWPWSCCCQNGSYFINQECACTQTKNSPAGTVEVTAPCCSLRPKEAEPDRSASLACCGHGWRQIIGSMAKIRCQVLEQVHVKSRYCIYAYIYIYICVHVHICVVMTGESTGIIKGMFLGRIECWILMRLIPLAGCLWNAGCRDVSRCLYIQSMLESALPNTCLLWGWS